MEYGGQDVPVEFYSKYKSEAPSIPVPSGSVDFCGRGEDWKGVELQPVEVLLYIVGAIVEVECISSWEQHTATWKINLLVF